MAWGGWRGDGQWLQITDVCINNIVTFLSFCRYILISEEDIRWDSGITSGEGGLLNKRYANCVK